MLKNAASSCKYRDICLTSNSIFRPAPQEDPALRLFCLPFAGAAATVYRLWPHGLPANVEIIALQLPGHGTRLRESPLRRLMDMAELALTEFSPLLDRPFAFFGHSMGALLARELAVRFTAQGQLPVHLFVSARGTHLNRDLPLLHGLSDDEFLTEVDRRYQGIPAQLREQRDILDLLLPALRADVEALETYDRDPCAPPLKCGISAYGGTRDFSVTPEELAAWQAETVATSRVRLFEGDHFYLETQRALVLADISEMLIPYLPGSFAGGVGRGEI
jgi:surfactin synthase thioesterase subunit